MYNEADFESRQVDDPSEVFKPGLRVQCWLQPDSGRTPRPIALRRIPVPLCGLQSTPKGRSSISQSYQSSMVAVGHDPVIEVDSEQFMGTASDKTRRRACVSITIKQTDRSRRTTPRVNGRFFARDFSSGFPYQLRPHAPLTDCQVSKLRKSFWIESRSAFCERNWVYLDNLPTATADGLILVLDSHRPAFLRRKLGSDSLLISVGIWANCGLGLGRCPRPVRFYCCISANRLRNSSNSIVEVRREFRSGEFD